MKIILLLVLTLSNPSVMYVGGNPKEIEIVSSPQEASIILWGKNQATSYYESWHGKLYKVDLASGTVKEIPIPQLKFEK